MAVEADASARQHHPSWKEQTLLARWLIVTAALASPLLMFMLSGMIPGFGLITARLGPWWDSLSLELHPLVLGIVVVDGVSLALIWLGALAVSICVSAYLIMDSGTTTPSLSTPDASASGAHSLRNAAQSWWSILWRACVFLAGGAMSIFLALSGLFVFASSSSYSRLTPVSEHGCELWTSVDPYFDDWYTGDIYVRQPWSLNLHRIDDWRIVDTSEGLEDEMHLHWEAETATLYVGLSEHRMPTNGATTFKRITVRCDTLEHRSEFLNEEQARG